MRSTLSASGYDVDGPDQTPSCQFSGRVPLAIVLDVERRHSGHQLRHLLRIVEHVPDHLRRRVELADTLELHCDTNSTRRLDSSGLVISRQTRSGGLWLSVTTASIPAERRASWMAAHTAWMPAPPPSPMPFVPRSLNGDGLSIDAVLMSGMSM